MVYETNKLVENNAKKQTQNNAGSTAVTNTNVLPAAPAKKVGADAGSQYVPGSNIDTAKTGLVDAANNLKIQGFADAAQKYNTQPAASDPNNINYATEMQKILALPQTPENQQKMQALVRGRNLKVALNPDAYGQYADDPYAKAAGDYLSYIAPESVNTQKNLDSMYANAGNRYQAQMDLMQQQHDIQNKAIAENYEKLRNQEFVNAARRALGTEEVLAAQGLGRGKSNAPSSGFGETSRIMAQTSLNNNIANAYLAEQKALEDLRNQLAQNQIQAYMDHADRVSNIDLQALDQANNDRNHYFNVQNANIQNTANREMFDWQKGTDARDFERNIFESDRSFNWQKDVDDRNYNRSAYEFDKSMEQNDKQFAAQNELDWYNVKNKGSGSGGYTYTFGGGVIPPLAGPQATVTDDTARNSVIDAMLSNGKENAIYVLAQLKQNGQISAVAAQNLVDELGLVENGGWFK